MSDRAGAAEAAELRFVIHNELDIIMVDDDDVCGGQNQSAKCLRHYIENVYNRTQRISTSLLWTQFFSNSIREKEKGDLSSHWRGRAGVSQKKKKPSNRLNPHIGNHHRISLSFDRVSPLILL